MNGQTNRIPMKGYKMHICNYLCQLRHKAADCFTIDIFAKTVYTFATILLLTKFVKCFAGISRKQLFEAFIKRSKPHFSIPSKLDKLLHETSTLTREFNTPNPWMFIN